MDMLIQPATILIGLGLLNLMVVLLYTLEYRKAKRFQSQNKDLVATNNEILNQSKQALSVHQALLQQIVKSTTGIGSVDKAEAEAAAIITQASQKAGEMNDQAVKLEQDLAQTVYKQQQENTTKVEALLQQTLDQAKDIITNSEALKGTVDAKLNALFDATITQSQALIKEKNDEFITQYQSQMTHISNEYIGILQNTNKNIETDFIQKSEAYLNEMKDRLIELSSQKREVMEKEMQKIQGDLDTYKKEQFTKIESNIYEILARAAESVIGQAVNFDQHQELIIKALEQAKREGLFI